MDTRNQLICLWSGYAFFPLYVIGFIFIAGFIPPPSPSLGAEEIAALFDHDRWNILVGMSIAVVASALFIPWCVAIFAQTSRIEAGARVISYVQLIAGSIGAAFFMIPPMIWVVMAYRTGHNPDTLLILDDFSWVAWIISWPFFFLQMAAVGLCGLLGKTGQKIVPRWAAYFSLWGGLTMFPASLIVFFKAGPFAWDGFFALYLPLALYATWYHVMLFVLLKAVKAQAQLQETAPINLQPALHS